VERGGTGTSVKRKTMTNCLSEEKYRAMPHQLGGTNRRREKGERFVKTCSESRISQDREVGRGKNGHGWRRRNCYEEDALTKTKSA